MSETEETIEVPVLELEFEKFLDICSKVNLIDSILEFSMPNHLSAYADREKSPIANLVQELLEYQRPENSWRVNEHKVVEFTIKDGAIYYQDKIIYDASRIIIVSKLNSAYIIPGEKSIKEGKCQPNQIIRLSNMISSQLFLLQFKDVKEEDSDKFDLRVEYALINRTDAKEKYEDSNQG